MHTIGKLLLGSASYRWKYSAKPSRSRTMPCSART